MKREWMKSMLPGGAAPVRVGAVLDFEADVAGDCGGLDGGEVDAGYGGWMGGGRFRRVRLARGLCRCRCRGLVLMVGGSRGAK